MNSNNATQSKRKLRVAILTTSFPIARKIVSGIFIQKLVQNLPIYIDVVVITPASVENSGAFQAKKYRLNYIRYGPRRWQKLAHQPGGIPVALKQHKMTYLLLPVLIASMFVQCMRASRHVDLIHANWSVNGLIAGLAGLVTRVPVITTLRGSDVNNINTSLLFNCILRGCLVLSDKVITVSDAILQKLAYEHPAHSNKLLLIPNGVDPWLLQIPLSKEESQKCRLLTVGSIVPNKGVNLTIEALCQLSDKSVYLDIIGDGLDKDKLKDKVTQYKLNSTVKFHGSMPHSEVIEKLRCADILILSSYHEGRPNIILEAMAAGVPVISSDIEGVRELIKHNVNGLLFKPGDTLELSTRIGQLRNDLNLRLRLANSAREFIVRNRLLWPKTGQLYAEQYEEIVSRNKKICAA